MSSIQPTDGIVTGTTTPGQSRPESNDNKAVLPQSARTESSPSDDSVS